MCASICLRVQPPSSMWASRSWVGSPRSRSRNAAQPSSMRARVSATRGCPLVFMAARSISRTTPLEVAEELGARAVAGPEEAEHRGGGHDRAGLPDAAHDRAEVVRLDHDADALRLEALV